jgi:hypothetical protein
MDLGLGSAAAIAFITFAVHTFVGGVRVARPLLADRSLPPASKWLNYYCWHIVTVLLAAMTAAFSYIALHPDLAGVGKSLGALALILAGLSAAVAFKAGIRPWRFPSTTLFLLMGVAAMI